MEVILSIFRDLAIVLLFIAQIKIYIDFPDFKQEALDHFFKITSNFDQDIFDEFAANSRKMYLMAVLTHSLIYLLQFLTIFATIVNFIACYIATYYFKTSAMYTVFIFQAILTAMIIINTPTGMATRLLFGMRYRWILGYKELLRLYNKETNDIESISDAMCNYRNIAIPNFHIGSQVGDSLQKNKRDDVKEELIINNATEFKIAEEFIEKIGSVKSENVRGTKWRGKLKKK